MNNKFNLLLLFGIAIILLSSFTDNNAVSISKLKKTENNLSEKSVYERYRVTAKTRNTYGTNYWVDLIIEGSVASWGNRIIKVFYDDGYGLKSISHSKDFTYENTYYVRIDGRTYYFTF